jgi:hypothetical protein
MGSIPDKQNHLVPKRFCKDWHSVQLTHKTPRLPGIQNPRAEHHNGRDGGDYAYVQSQVSLAEL